MQCLRCGREIIDGQVFCDSCQNVMAKHPVKPNTVVTIPDRTVRVRSTGVRKPVKVDENTDHLRRTILQLRRAREPAIGQNYTSIVDYGSGGR